MRKDKKWVALFLLLMVSGLPIDAWTQNVVRPAGNAVQPSVPFYRVWRGFARPELLTAEFLGRLQPFIVGTKEFLAAHKGVAYLPVVPPAGSPANIPSELAIVAYKSRADYERERATSVGQRYQDSHWDLFDKPGQRTKSGGPAPYGGEIVTDVPYDVAGAPVDWQSQAGGSRFFLGNIRNGTSLDQLAELVSRMQKTFGEKGLDGHIVVADGNQFFASWQHWSSQEQSVRAEQSEAGRKIIEARNSLLEPILDAPAAFFDGNVRQGGVYNVRFSPKP